MKKTVFSCSECGRIQSKWSGSCLSCGSWNSFVEEVAREAKKVFSHAKAVSLTEITFDENNRQKVSIAEFDRILGGGAVLGSLILIGGEPGIGKSTLLLQAAQAFADQGLKVLYVCGEESLQQTSMRAKRLGVKSNNLFLLHETLFDFVKEQIEEVGPKAVIVDSIQVMYKEEILSSPGSIVQVKSTALEFMKIAKSKGIILFLVGHITKSGDIAGPRVLEHIVDVVLDFEGDKERGFRVLRSLKNRFGSTEEIALFQMREGGLFEIPNPSSAFLEGRIDEAIGSVVVPTVEGCRAILVEAQALVTKSIFPMPARKSTGIDGNRLALLIAVLEKRAKFNLHNSDVFVSIAGGLKIVEPAIDLGLAVAIASSFSGRMMDCKTVVMGEVGLGGEVRSISKVELRIREASNMGFQRCILPKRNLQNLAGDFKIELIGVDLLDEALRLFT